MTSENEKKKNMVLSMNNDDDIVLCYTSFFFRLGGSPVHNNLIDFVFFISRLRFQLSPFFFSFLTLLNVLFFGPRLQGEIPRRHEGRWVNIGKRRGK